MHLQCTAAYPPAQLETMLCCQHTLPAVWRDMLWKLGSSAGLRGLEGSPPCWHLCLCRPDTRFSRSTPTPGVISGLLPTFLASFLAVRQIARAELMPMRASRTTSLILCVKAHPAVLPWRRADTFPGRLLVTGPQQLPRAGLASSFQLS